MSDDTPTQRFDTPTGTAGDAAGDAVDREKNKARGLMVALITVGAVLLIALIVVLVLLLGGGKPVAVATTTPTATASDSPTPTATASATPTPTPTQTTTPPPPSGPTLISFTTGTPTVMCDSRTGNPIPLSFRWAGSNGSVVYVAVGATSDPKANGQGWELPTIGTQADFPSPLDYGCYNATATYSLGIYDAAGHKSVKQITIKNTGEVH